jgi:putative membrane protein insertion efficiency factor
MGKLWLRWPVECLFWIYRCLLSPLNVALFGPAARCRFVPSCSTYARTYIRRHGLARALVPILLRLLRCNPFHPGGIDPVPD